MTSHLKGGCLARTVYQLLGAEVGGQYERLRMKASRDVWYSEAHHYQVSMGAVIYIYTLFTRAGSQSIKRPLDIVPLPPPCS
jgi:hypothetical protein